MPHRQLFIADFHIHSKYSLATSKYSDPEHLSFWAARKGLHLVGTGDFTHSRFRQELREKLKPAEDGFYVLRDSTEEDFFKQQNASNLKPRFVVSGEISCIYKKKSRVYKIHNVIILPGLDEADALSAKLSVIGNINSDGRPILKLDSKNLLEITLEVCSQAIFFPAHIWTPHFSLFGAYFGFDTIEECFEDLTCYIHCLETGLSSDPIMNRRISALDDYLLISNSDAHSPQKLAREANIFDTEFSYDGIARALSKVDDGFKGTIEFFPEEGKYHYDGHRSCGIYQTPEETAKTNGICPVCGGKITVGVLNRVEKFADRNYKNLNLPVFESLIPLSELITAATGLKGVKNERLYESLLQTMGTELGILREKPLEEIEKYGGKLIADSIGRVRKGEILWRPGYDGEYGKVTI